MDSKFVNLSRSDSLSSETDLHTVTTVHPHELTMAATAAGRLGTAPQKIDMQTVRFAPIPPGSLTSGGVTSILTYEGTPPKTAAKRKMPQALYHDADSGPSRKRTKHAGRRIRVRAAGSTTPTPVLEDEEELRSNDELSQAWNQRREQKDCHEGGRRMQQEPDTSDAEQTIALLSKQLREACDQVASLQSTLNQTETEIDARHRRVCQDMLFDILLQKEKAAKELQSERNRWSRIAASTRAELEAQITEKTATMDTMLKAHEQEVKSHKEHVARINTHLASERSRHSRRLVEINNLQCDLDSVKTMLRTSDEDLAELQRIDIEEKLIRDKKNSGLPPAYGSLDDVESLAPHGRHEDSGKVEVATIKHTVRDRFMRDLARAQNSSNQLREAPHAKTRETAGQELYLLAVTALAEACWSMDAILASVEDVPERPDQRPREDSENEPPRPVISKRRFIANRIAKLVIDFCWKILACFDIRPLEVKLGLRVKAETGKYMRAADDALLKALQGAIMSGRNCDDDPLSTVNREDDPCPGCHNLNCAGHCERLNELQYFLTQLTSLAWRFDKLTSKDMTSPSFPDTFSWLTENVETERRLAANTRPPPTRQTSPATEEALAASAAAAVTASRCIDSRMSASAVVADVQTRLRQSQQRSTASTQTPRPVPSLRHSGGDMMTMSSHYIMATIENMELGTTVPGIVVRNRGASGEGEGEMFAVELGRLDESVHVVVNQGAWQ